MQKKTEKQIRIGKTASDEALFKELRKGLYLNDLLVFLKNSKSNSIFVVGIPKKYFEGKYIFETARNTKTFKGEVYNLLDVYTTPEKVYELLQKVDELTEENNRLKELLMKEMTKNEKDKVRQDIEIYIKNNLKHFELEGVEFTKEDFDLAEEKVMQGKSIEDACDEVLKEIRECLDEGLDELEY